MMKLILSTLILPCVLILSSCHDSQRDNVQPPKVPPFSIKAMHWYDSTMAPAISEQVRLPEKQATIYAQTLYHAAHEHYPTVNLISPNRLRQVLGKHYQDFARYFWQNGWLVLQDRQRLELNFPHLRYVFFTRIMQDKLTHKRSERKAKNQTKPFQTYTTIRDLVLKIQVYDLQAKRVVWNNQDSIAKTTVKTYQDTAKHPYPNAESTYDISLALYQKMVQRLPQSEKA